MAILRLKEIREMSEEQLEEKLKEISTELGKMGSQARSGGAPENAGKMGELKKTIARIKTILKEKKD